MELKANCKINIGLDILRKRCDGYHELATVLYPVYGLHDTVHAEKTDRTGLDFTSEGIVIDCPAEKNICVKAFELMRVRYGVDGLRMHLDKRVPFGAGLGGGSSDGTAVIMAINALFDLGLTESELTGIAAELGSDTAFFVRNTPQLCTGRGEIMSPVNIDIHGMTLVIAKPAEGVSTREAYAGVVPHIPSEPIERRISRPVSSWKGSVVNDFEGHIFRAHPQIAALKDAFYKQGAIYASMSGSGSAVYGLFDGDVPFIPPFSGLFLHKETIL